MKRVGVLIDFTNVSDVALQHALLIPQSWYGEIYLVHIAEPGKRSIAIEKLEFVANQFSQHGLTCIPHVDEGAFFMTIPKTLKELALDLILVGTHGIKSMSDPNYGLDIIRLIDSVDIPFLVFQDHSKPPEMGFNEVLLPILKKQSVISHAPFLTDFLVANKSRLTLMDIGEEETNEDAVMNKYKDLFHALRSRFVYDFESEAEIVGGLGKSILQYASIEDAKIIAVIRRHVNQVIDEEEFQQILLNRHGFAIMVLS